MVATPELPHMDAGHQESEHRSQLSQLIHMGVLITAPAIGGSCNCLRYLQEGEPTMGELEGPFFDPTMEAEPSLEVKGLMEAEPVPETSPEVEMIEEPPLPEPVLPKPVLPEPVLPSAIPKKTPEKPKPKTKPQRNSLRRGRAKTTPAGQSKTKSPKAKAKPAGRGTASKGTAKSSKAKGKAVPKAKGKPPADTNSRREKDDVERKMHSAARQTQVHTIVQ